MILFCTIVPVFDTEFTAYFHWSSRNSAGGTPTQSNNPEQSHDDVRPSFVCDREDVKYGIPTQSDIGNVCIFGFDRKTTCSPQARPSTRKIDDNQLDLYVNRIIESLNNTTARNDDDGGNPVIESNDDRSKTVVSSSDTLHIHTFHNHDNEQNAEEPPLIDTKSSMLEHYTKNTDVVDMYNLMNVQERRDAISSLVRSIQCFGHGISVDEESIDELVIVDRNQVIQGTGTSYDARSKKQLRQGTRILEGYM